MHHPIDRITHTRAFVSPVVKHWLERGIAQWVQPMKDRSDDPSRHERTNSVQRINNNNNNDDDDDDDDDDNNNNNNNDNNSNNVIKS